MRKLRERLNNKKGFTLVELIVVIVIILILAAVLVPNVMRYIGQARESTFQSEASAYLTELQGYVAEYYAKNDEDVDESTFSEKLTDFDTVSDDVLDIAVLSTSTPETYSALSAKTASGKSIKVAVDKGAVTKFSYATTQYYVTWEQESGWTDVAK